MFAWRVNCGIGGVAMRLGTRELTARRPGGEAINEQLFSFIRTNKTRNIYGANSGGQTSWRGILWLTCNAMQNKNALPPSGCEGRQEKGVSPISLFLMFSLDGWVG